MANFYEDFITELLKRTNLTDEKGVADKEYVTSLAEELEKRMGLKVLGALPKEHLEEYMKFVNENTAPEAIQTFLQEHVADFKNVRQAVLVDFAKNFAARTEKLRESLQ